MSKTIQEKPVIDAQGDKPQGGRQPWFMVVCTCLVVLFTLLITNPIARAGNLHLLTDISLPKGFQPPAMPFLTGWGRWLPLDLHLTQNVARSMYLTTNVEVAVIVAVLFVLYVASLYFVARRARVQDMRAIRTWLWIGLALAGIVLVLLPGMASKDIFVYADYGDTFGRHAANPYFVLPIQVSPHDQLTQIDGWNNAFSAYGPLWSYITAVIALVLGDHPLANFYGYRVLGFVWQIISVVLVGAILRAAGRSERTVTLGMLVYAWCPLTLFEGILGGHNDAFMGVLILLGIWLAFRAERNGLTRPVNYIPVIIALSLAGLVKFTSIPLVIFFLILLAGRALGRPASSGRSLRWGEALKHVIIAGAVFVVLTVAFYLPLWLGHSLRDIVYSFGAPPSSSKSQNSLMRVGVEYLKSHTGKSLGTTVMHILASHTLWTGLEVLGLLACFALCAWRTWSSPTLRTFVIWSLGGTTVLLLVTPWFYSWYVIWLVTLVSALFAFPLGRWGRALILFSLVFSVSALMTYVDMSLLGNQLVIRYALIIVPPLVVGLVAFFSPARQQTSELAEAQGETLADEA